MYVIASNTVGPTPKLSDEVKPSASKNAFRDGEARIDDLERGQAQRLSTAADPHHKREGECARVNELVMRGIAAVNLTVRHETDAQRREGPITRVKLNTAAREAKRSDPEDRVRLPRWRGPKHQRRSSRRSVVTRPGRLSGASGHLSGQLSRGPVVAAARPRGLRRHGT
ncbi:MAG: hypothetical protein IPQ07_40225 [Myxococcales bacterium]|nr:hypothetical protein [Myxococcales bacterium]